MLRKTGKETGKELSRVLEIEELKQVLFLSSQPTDCISFTQAVRNFVFVLVYSHYFFF